MLKNVCKVKWTNLKKVFYYCIGITDKINERKSDLNIELNDTIKWHKSWVKSWRLRVGRKVRSKSNVRKRIS